MAELMQYIAVNCEHHQGDPDDLFADTMKLAYNVFLRHMPIKMKNK
jgi:hypothetical protein